jgi:uncharacterized protein YqeY
MSLKKRIVDQLTKSIKAKDVVGKNTLRMLLAAVKNREVEVRGELDDQEMVQVIRRQVNQHRDSIQMYEDGGRGDLVDQEQQELDLLLSFLPEQPSESSIHQIVADVIGEVSATGMKDMGRVMKAVMARLAGSADGKLVNEIVKKHLNN